jgi:deazaflavin-dependent oxidoreductase (nitroreductase family)
MSDASTIQPAPAFRKPSSAERWLNKAFGAVVGLGFGLPHNHLVLTRGRKSGRLYSTPVNVLVHAGKSYLVAPRGETQWVRNARSAGEVVLKKGRRRQSYRLRELDDGEKPPLLEAYLDQFRTTVQRYFPVAAGSGAEAFADLASRYPVFELLPATEARQGDKGGAT